MVLIKINCEFDLPLMVHNTIVHNARESQAQCATDACIYQPIVESSEAKGTTRDPSPNTSMKH